MINMKPSQHKHEVDEKNMKSSQHGVMLVDDQHKHKVDEKI
jgi:hypothetical protein